MGSVQGAGLEELYRGCSFTFGKAKRIKVGGFRRVWSEECLSILCAVHVNVAHHILVQNWQIFLLNFAIRQGISKLLGTSKHVHAWRSPGLPNPELFTRRMRLVLVQTHSGQTHSDQVDPASV